MEEIFARIMEDLGARVTGRMQFRLILQPLLASIFAIMVGLRDARAGEPPYFWAQFRRPKHRTNIFKDGWQAVGQVFVLAIILDIVYQLIVQRWVWPGEAIIVAFLLAIVPYLLLRGLVNRIVSRFIS